MCLGHMAWKVMQNARTGRFCEGCPQNPVPEGDCSTTCNTITQSFWAAAAMNFTDGLATETWVKIFAQLLPQTRDIDPDQATTAALARDQIRFHKLKLVCSRFNAILQDASFNFPIIALDLRKSNNPSLMTWLQAQGGQQETLLLTSTCKSAKSFLVPFAKAGSPVTTIGWGAFDKRAPEALTTLTTITSLALWSPAQSANSLDPLQSLPSLQKLLLSSGSFTIAGLPKHLTSLGLKQVQLSSANSFTRDMRLKKLSIVSSSFVGHAILGNKLLEELEISESLVKVPDDEDYDDAELAGLSTGHECFFCADLSYLRNLRVLKLKVASQCTRGGSDELSFEQLYFCYRLPLLEELRLESTCMPVCIADELTQLSSLTSLAVSAASAQSAYNTRGLLIIMPEWLSMASLQHVHLSHANLRCGTEFLGLLSMKTLVSLRLTNCTPANQRVGELIAALMYGMGKHNPHVEVSFNNRRLTDLLDLDRTLPKAADDEWW